MVVGEHEMQTFQFVVVVVLFLLLLSNVLMPTSVHPEFFRQVGFPNILKCKFVQYKFLYIIDEIPCSTFVWSLSFKTRYVLLLPTSISQSPKFILLAEKLQLLINYFSILMRNSLLQLYALWDSTLVMCSISANLKLSIFHTKCKWTLISIFSITILVKFSPLPLYKFCLSTLVLCSFSFNSTSTIMSSKGIPQFTLRKGECRLHFR